MEGSNAHIQEALEIAGTKGRFQKTVVVLLCLAWIQIAFMMIGGQYIFMSPMFKCSFNDKLVPEHEACPRISQCQISYPSTLTVYAGLYCEREIDRDIIQSLVYVGCIAGCLIINPLADTKGRKISFLFALLACSLGILLNIAGGLIKSVVMLTLGSTLCGFGAYSAMIIIYIFISDFSWGQEEFKTNAMMIVNIFWGVAECILAIFYYWLPGWQTYLLWAQLIPITVLALVFSFFIPETPFFLAYSNKNEDLCLKSLEKIAIVNGIEKDERLRAHELVKKGIEELKDEQQKKPLVQNPVVYILKTEHRNVVFFVSVLIIGSNIYYYCVQYSLNGLGFNFGINVLFAGLAEIFGYLTINLFINDIPRRRGVLISSIVSFLFGILFAFNFVNQDLLLASLIVGLCRISNTYTRGFLPLLLVESFPKKIQTTGAGMISSISEIGSFATPYMMTGILRLGQKPIIFFSVASLVLSTIPLIFVKQTKDTRWEVLNEQDTS